MAYDFDPETFIKEVKKRPALWDLSSSEYADRHVRNKCWDELVDIFIEDEVITNEKRNKLVSSLQLKWKSIRASFTREIARQKRLESGGISASRKSEYIYFKDLQFLKDFTGIRKGSYPQKLEYSRGYYEVRKPNRLKKKRKKSEDSVSVDDFFTADNTNTDYTQNIEQDDDKLFLKSLLTNLKMVPEHKKIATKIQIMTVLDEATQTNYIHYE